MKQAIEELETAGRLLTAQLPIEELVEQMFKMEHLWEETRKPEFNQVRVWMIEEIERRYPKATDSALTAWSKQENDPRKYSQVIAQAVIDSLQKHLF